jgi:hypothetical protein
MSRALKQLRTRTREEVAIGIYDQRRLDLWMKRVLNAVQLSGTRGRHAGVRSSNGKSMGSCRGGSRPLGKEGRTIQKLRVPLKFDSRDPKGGRTWERGN